MPSPQAAAAQAMQRLLVHNRLLDSQVVNAERLLYHYNKLGEVASTIRKLFVKPSWRSSTFLNTTSPPVKAISVCKCVCKEGSYPKARVAGPSLGSVRKCWHT